MIQTAANLLLAALVILAPWPVAGNLAYARFAFLIVVFVTLLISVVERFRSTNDKECRHANRPMWIWFPLMLGIAYSAFQTIDLNQFGWSETISRPTNIESVVGSGSDGKSSINAISIYPEASRIKLVDLILGISVFVATTLTIRDSKDATRLLVSLVFVGAAASFFGILQAVSWNGELFWQYELTQGGRVFGSFVNRNNASGFLVITLSAAVAIAAQYLIKSADQAEQALDTTSTLGQRVEKSRSGVIRRLTEVLAKLETQHLYLALAIGLTIVGILMTLSRGGVIAMGSVLILSALMLRKTNGTLVTAFTLLMMMAVIGFIGYLGFDQKLSDRFEELSVVEFDTTPRIAHWTDMLPAISESTWGVGSGTYRIFSPQFQSFDFDRVYAHAENVYIETLIELGYSGIILIVVVVSLCLWSSIKLARSNRSFDRSLGLFGLATLTGTGIASLLDFGLYQPANMIAMAVAMGVVTHRAQIQSANRTPTMVSRTLIASFSVVIICCVVWAGYYSYGVESLRWAKRSIRLAQEHQNASDPLLSKKSLRRIESALTVAKSICPQNEEVLFYLGELELLRYQKANAKLISESLAMQLNRDDITDQERESYQDYTPDKVWASSSITALNANVFQALRDNNVEFLDQLKLDPLVESHLRTAYEHYRIAETLRLKSIGTNLRLAQLAPVFEPNETAVQTVSARVKTALDSPFPNTEVLYEAGLLSLNAGEVEEAVSLWAKCLRKPAGRRFEQAIVQLSMAELPIQPFFEQVLPQEPETLLRVVKNYFRSPELILPKRLLLMHTEGVIRGMKDSLPEAGYYFSLAETQRLSDQFDAAVISYEKALELEPDETILRFNYSQCLKELKRFDEAIQQLQRCQLQPSPIFPQIKPLIERIRNEQSTEIKSQTTPPRSSPSGRSTTEGASRIQKLFLDQASPRLAFQMIGETTERDGVAAVIFTGI